MSELLNMEVVQEDRQLVAGWEKARGLVDELRSLGRRAGHVTILLGAELLRLKESVGASHGGSRRSSTQNANLKWTEQCEAETGLSYDTCQRAMALAKAAQSQVPELLMLNEGEFLALAAPLQQQIMEKLRAISDGKTMSQMWFEFGLCKNGRTTPPRPGKKGTLEDLTLGQRMEAGLAGAETVRLVAEGGLWRALSTEDLAVFDRLLETWRGEIRALLSQRAEAEAKTTATKRRVK